MRRLGIINTPAGVGGIIEIGGAMLVQAEQLTTAAAQNLANATTPGYKAHRPFGSLILAEDAGTQPVVVDGASDRSAGKLVISDNPDDLAIAGDGYFLVRFGNSAALSRAGEFLRDAGGRLVTPDGGVLQSTQGDLDVGSGDFKVASDGTVTVDGAAAAKLVVMTVADQSALRPLGGGAMTAAGADMREVDRPDVRQGMLETSNVSTAQEMVTIMSSLRSAEAGQQIIQTYQDLVAQAISTFGQRAA